MSSQSNLCPVCNKNDRTQKVSAAYQEGAGSGQVWDNQSEGLRYQFMQSDLSISLEPPTLPNSGLGNMTLVVALIGGAILVVLVNGSIAAGASVYVYGLLAILGAIDLACIVWSIKSESRKRRLRPIVKNAIERWKRLYYCHRDGVVFDPDTGDCAEVSNMNELLY